MRTTGVLVLACWAGAAAAQSPPYVESAPITTFKAHPSITVLMMPAAAGSAPVLPAPAIASIEQRTVTAKRDVDVREVLKGGHLSFDPQTLEQLKRLNPDLRSDWTLPAGKKFTYFAPSAEVSAAQPHAVPGFINIAQASRLSVREQVSESARIKAGARLLKISNFASPQDAVLHQKLTDSIDNTAKLVDRQAPAMSARDLALSRYYLQQANARANALTNVGSGVQIASAQITLLQGSTQPLQAMSFRMETGQAPFQNRQVQVDVAPGTGSPQFAAFRVYVLPVGVINDPSSYPPDLIRDLLQQLTFEDLTTPSSSPVPLGEMAIWIGPDHQYDAMATMVVQKRAIAYKLMHANFNPNTLALKFNAPGEVVNP